MFSWFSFNPFLHKNLRDSLVYFNLRIECCIILMYVIEITCHIFHSLYKITFNAFCKVEENWSPEYFRMTVVVKKMREGVIRFFNHIFKNLQFYSQRQNMSLNLSCFLSFISRLLIVKNSFHLIMIRSISKSCLFCFYVIEPFNYQLF